VPFRKGYRPWTPRKTIFANRFEALKCGNQLARTSFQNSATSVQGAENAYFGLVRQDGTLGALPNNFVEDLVSATEIMKNVVINCTPQDSL
jgi:hypothetical protein